MESLLINDYSNMYIEIESDCAGGLSADDLVVSFYINDDGKAETVDRVGLSDTRYDDLRQTKDLVDLAIDPSTVPDGLCVPKVRHLSPPFTLQKVQFGNIYIILSFMSAGDSQYLSTREV